MSARHIPIRRKVVYVAVIVAFTFAVAEVGLRVRAWLRYGSASSGLRDPMLTYDAGMDLLTPTPGYELKGAKIHIKINSHGFRGDEFSIVKPANTFRIVCLGASTTFSAEASSNHATWTHRLQEKLQAAYPARRIEVINAAVAGYVAADNLKNLRHRVLGLNPDLVVYYEANNEIVRDTRELAVHRGLISNDGGRQPAWTRTLSRYSLMFDLAYKNVAIIGGSRAGSDGKIDRIPRELPSRFIGVLEEMRLALAERNVPLVLATFIVKYRRDQDRATQISNADVAFYYMPWMSIEGMLDAMDVYNEAIVDYAKRAGLMVVDDRSAIPPDAEHFADCMHLTDLGNELMADRFVRSLSSHGNLLLIRGL